MKPRKIFRSQSARRDAAEIWHYIATDNIKAADDLLQEIDATLHLLAGMPGIGTPRNEIQRGLRAYPVKSYLIMYRPVKHGIFVSRIVHGARDLPQLFERE